MRAVVQRVREASVEVAGCVGGLIGKGLLVYLSVAHDDTDADVAYVADKVCHLRIFPDQEDRMNLDVTQAQGKVLVVSAFTVQADARRGRRPSFESAAAPAHAMDLYEAFCQALADQGLCVERGSFGRDMTIQSMNDGPVCILLDSRRVF